MKKEATFEWDEHCQNALDSLKKYILNPPVLMAPKSDRPFLLDIVALPHSLGAMLAQHNDEGKEVACYYLS
jgi:hypothetical protein